MRKAALEAMGKLAADNSKLPLCGLVHTVFTTDEFTLRGALQNAGYTVEFEKLKVLTQARVWADTPNHAVVDPETGDPEPRTLVAQGMSDTEKDSLYQAVYAAMREEVAAAAAAAEGAAE